MVDPYTMTLEIYGLIIGPPTTWFIGVILSTIGIVIVEQIASIFVKYLRKKRKLKKSKGFFRRENQLLLVIISIVYSAVISLAIMNFPDEFYFILIFMTIAFVVLWLPGIGIGNPAQSAYIFLLILIGFLIGSQIGWVMKGMMEAFL